MQINITMKESLKKSIKVLTIQALPYSLIVSPLEGPGSAIAGGHKSSSPHNVSSVSVRSEEKELQEVEENFESFSKQISNLEVDLLSLEEKLQIYGLFKQAKEGDCKDKQPHLLDFKPLQKWRAWRKYKGISRIEAMRQYNTLAKRLLD